MYIIREFKPDDIAAVKAFTDEQIGLNYYSLDELKDAQKRSLKNGITTSFILENEGLVHGLRLAYAPGQWSHGKGSKLRPDLWCCGLEHMGYFQSLFLSQSAQGHGWGPKMSQKSIEAIKKLGAKAILTHCWKESPKNGSFKYLSKVGFKTIVEHPNYWIDLDYVCTRDGKPCRCTAIEMQLELK